MISLTYLSTAAVELRREELTRLLETCRANNQQHDLTGLLVYAGGHFIQTLEGPAQVVDAAFTRISADPRHRDVFVTLREDVEDRFFPSWSMAFEHVPDEELAELHGFSDYLDPESDLYANTASLGRAGIFHRVFRDNMR